LNLPAQPRQGELLILAIFAVFLRVIVFASAMHFGHLSIWQYTSKGDTSSYIANAAAMCGERPRTSLSEYDLRVFPGYPSLISIVHLLRISLPVSALCVTWISAGIAAAAAGRVFDDARVGWAMTCLIPHYLINSSLGMSEAPLLAVVCVALLAFKKDRLILCGGLFAFAGMIRPMACFACAGVLFALVTPVLRYPQEPGAATSDPALGGTSEPASRTWTNILLLLAAAGLTFAFQVIAFQLWTGDALRGIHVYSQNPGAYGGHLLAWPFHSLLTTAGIDRSSTGRILYIWIHVGVTLTACAMLTYRTAVLPTRDQRDLISFPWLIGNTVFVLCIGSVWGFRHFPRFTIPAAPPMFWSLRRVLPRHAGWWMLIAAGCGVMAVRGVIDSP
jgi:hypothetical protein